MIILEWFNAREAAEAGTSLADKIAPQNAPGPAAAENKVVSKAQAIAIQEVLRRADLEVRPLRLNVYKRAKFANAFKWRLVANGIDGKLADDLTQKVVLHLFLNQATPTADRSSAAASAERSGSSNGQHLLRQANKYFESGAYTEAAASYEDFVKLFPLDPNAVDAANNLGAALCKLGRYKEAEAYFRQAIEIRGDNPEIHCNLGNLLRWTGRAAESEVSLRRALKLKPTYANARASLGLTLLHVGRLRDAKARFEKVLKATPRHVDALIGAGQVAKMEGRFDDAEAVFKRVLEVSPDMPTAWAAQVSIRKMTSADAAWLERAEKIAASGIAPLDEADLRFAIGKYCDDVDDFATAFRSYKRGNELLKGIAENYVPEGRTAFVDDMIRVYTRDAVSPAEVASTSVKPILVVGMMRSGTSLAEQIISSHPSVEGAGELEFWGDAVREHETAVREGLLGGPLRKQLADVYLRALSRDSTDAPRIVDKAPVNSDHLGVIHSVFPKARIIYMQRDPIDTCLSCYFQQFSTALNFTMDLSDVAHYYREHQRLIAHWRAVLPPGTILDVPYAELVADQEGWTRKILDFLGLEWDGRCLDFHQTKRSVVTACSWQVRQKIYTNSVGRWRNYEKFIGPLLGLRN